MANGIKVFNADGSLQFDLTNRLFRTLKTANVGTTDGSTTFTKDPADTAIIARVDTDGIPPQLTVGSSSVSWAYGDVPAATRGSGKLSVLAY